MSGTAAAGALVSKLRDAILDPLILLLVAAAIVVFFWGAFQYVYGASQGDVQEEGKKHMLWGIIGLVIMMSAYAILTIATGTFGIEMP